MELEEKEKILKRLYNNPNYPSSFAGVDQLWIEAKKELPNIKKKEIKEWLEGSRTYTIHRPRRVNFPRQKTIPSGYMTDVQVDIADLQKISKENNGINYALIAIDILSKQVFGVPVKNKNAKDMLAAFKNLFELMPMKPHRLFSDKGKEFTNSDLKTFFKENDIQKFTPNSSTVKASLAERAIRNVKQRLYRYMSQKQTVEWVPALSKIINAINNSKSRTHGMKPSEVNFNNAKEVWEKLYGPREDLIESEIKKPPKFKKDDFVRMSKNKGVFHKGYFPSWSDEILQIEQVKNQNPPRYKVRDQQGELFKGYFYEPDLQKVRKDESTTYRIEEVIRTKKVNGRKKYFVKFYDYPNPEWIDESDIAPTD
jgi:hypothetical protein